MTAKQWKSLKPGDYIFKGYTIRRVLSIEDTTPFKVKLERLGGKGGGRYVYIPMGERQSFMYIPYKNIRKPGRPQNLYVIRLSSVSRYQLWKFLKGRDNGLR